jgi:hypothetical protein
MIAGSLRFTIYDVRREAGNCKEEICFACANPALNVMPMCCLPWLTMGDGA